MDEFLQSVANNLRTYRKKKNLKQVDVSKLTGIDNSTLSKLESGARVPDLMVLKTLAELYEVSIAELVGGPNEMRYIADREAYKILEVIQSLKPEERKTVLSMLYGLEYKNRLES